MRSYSRPRDVHLVPPDPAPDLGRGRLCVVTPIYQPTLSREEAISLDLLRRFCPQHLKVILKPTGLVLPFDASDFRVVELDPANFAGISAYNKLMMTPWFYELFAGYEAILIYQTDCLILGDGLEAWPDRPWSYVGAPFLRRDGQLKAVGNGGFSLRRPGDFLKVLTSRRMTTANLSGALMKEFAKGTYFKILMQALKAGNAADFVEVYARAEDEFWSFYAPLFHADYRVAPAAEAARFAAETKPRRIAELAGAPPLGGHAWTVHDRPYWEARLKALGVEP
jgi:hypothetical protein